MVDVPREHLTAACIFRLVWSQRPPRATPAPQQRRLGGNPGWGDKRRAALEERITGCIVLPATDRVTSLWATYHAKLRDQLGRSGGNDMWIAACAAAQQPPLPVVTNNLDDYRRLFHVLPFPLVHQTCSRPA